MNEHLKEEYLSLLETKLNNLKYNKLEAIFPETGPYRRELYKAHMEFIRASLHHSRLAFIAANRVGKTEVGAFMMACHLTGRYPSWYEGKKFLNAVDAWAAGKTNKKTKEIIQRALLGPDNDRGSGMLPKDTILDCTSKSGVPDAVETIYVRHISGGVSVLELKSYEMGRDGFEGTKQQVIWLDEEPPLPSIYSECCMRLTDEFRPGILFCTFTPLFGLSDIVLKFLPNGKAPEGGINPANKDMYVVQATWDDAPHIPASEKEKLWNDCLPHEREARSKGSPSLGSGAIYPYLEEDIVCDPFPIPVWWPRAYGLDTGWKRTAAIWGATDPDSGTTYLYSEHYLGHALPAIHASAIRARGDWMIGAADPAGVNLSDGTRIFDLYLREGLDLEKADKRDRESGIWQVSQLLATGQLKIFSNLVNLLDEIRIYRRDEKGEIIKDKDHALDAMRYLMTTGVEFMRLPPDYEDAQKEVIDSQNRDKHTGY